MKPSFAPIPVSKLTLTSLNKSNPPPAQHSNQISGNKPILPPPPPLPPTQTGPLSNAINKVISNGTSKPPMPIRAPAPTPVPTSIAAAAAPAPPSNPVAPPAAAGGATTVSIQAYFADLSRAKTEINAVYHDIATKEKDLLNLRIEGQHEFDAAQKKSINELNKEYTELIKHSKELNSAIVKNTQVMEGYNSMMIKNTQTLEEVANHLLTLKNSVGVVAQHQPSAPLPPPPNSPVPPQQKTRGRKAATEPKPSKRQRKNKNKITSDDETEDPAAAGAVPEENKGSDDQQQQQVDSHDGLFVTNSNLTLEDLANAEGNGVVEEGNSGGEQVDSDGRSLGSQLAF